MNAATKEIAMQLVSSAENSTLDWRSQYGYIQDIHDGRGYTGGIIGFCSGTSDMLAAIRIYTRARPGNRLAAFLPALTAIETTRAAGHLAMTASHAGLDPGFVSAWRAAAADPLFRSAQDTERDQEYFDPAVSLAVADGLDALGQFAYFDAIVMHGAGGLAAIRGRAQHQARTPAEGGDETRYLHAFLEERKVAMKQEAAHLDTSRVDDEQLVFLDKRNLTLTPPLAWHTYGDAYRI